MAEITTTYETKAAAICPVCDYPIEPGTVVHLMSDGTTIHQQHPGERVYTSPDDT